ncbi:MAG: hypothetical protein AAGE52_23190 [Myxococcota bacterium]
MRKMLSARSDCFVDFRELKRPNPRSYPDLPEALRPLAEEGLKRIHIWWSFVGAEFDDGCGHLGGHFLWPHTFVGIRWQSLEGGRALSPMTTYGVSGLVYVEPKGATGGWYVSPKPLRNVDELESLEPVPDVMAFLSEWIECGFPHLALSKERRRAARALLYPSTKPKKIKPAIGKRVWAKKPANRDDIVRGEVTAVEGKFAQVAWDEGGRTWCKLKSLAVISGRDQYERMRELRAVDPAMLTRIAPWLRTNVSAALPPPHEHAFINRGAPLLAFLFAGVPTENLQDAVAAWLSEQKLDGNRGSVSTEVTTVSMDNHQATSTYSAKSMGRALTDMLVLHELRHAGRISERTREIFRVVPRDETKPGEGGFIDAAESMPPDFSYLDPPLSFLQKHGESAGAPGPMRYIDM